MTPYSKILKLVWPLALGMVNNAVMQFVDRAFLAHESMASLEAALPASILAFTGLGFFQSVVAYSGTFVAQYRGAGDVGMSRQARRAGTAIACVSGVVTLALVPLGLKLLSALSPSYEVLSREESYFSIVTCGGVFLYLQAALGAYFTGLGRTRLVFWVNLAGNLVNVALDPILIFGWLGVPALGIAGAAYATVFAMFVQWIALAFFVMRDERRALHAGGGQAGRTHGAGAFASLVWRIVRFGVPSGAYTTLNLVSFTIFVFVTGRVGDVAFAVSNACFAVNYLLFAPMEGFSLGAATLVGQAQGAKDPKRAHADAMRTLALGVGFVALLSVLSVAFCRPILSLFAPDPSVSGEFYSLGFKLFLLMAAWQVFDAADIIVCGALKGAGDTAFVFWWMLAVAFGMWLPLVFVVARFCNTMPALWGTMIVYVVVICTGTAVRWSKGRWKSISVLAAKGLD